MSQQLKKKFIGNDQVDGEKILIEQSQAIRAKDSTNATVDLIKLNGADQLVIPSDAVVEGDLIVQGAITSIESATLEVEDANVVVNKNGTVASADSQGAGITVEMSDAADAALSFDSTVASKFKIGEIGTQYEVVTVDHAQTLISKTIDADNNTISNLELDNLKAGVLNTSTALAAASDLQVPSALAVKTYVDDAVAGKDEASEISFDNVASGLAAVNVQEALDEIEGRVDTLEIGGGDTKQVKISANDTTEGYIEDKIVGASGKISITTLNDGANEDLQIDIGADVFDKTVDDTDAIFEGASNLYFTEARAKSAAVSDAIVDGVTDVAPSQNAVFDALALKVNKAGDTMSGLLDITVAGAAAIEANDIIIGEPWGIGYSVITVKDGNADEFYVQSADQLGAFAGQPSKIAAFQSGFTEGANSGAVLIKSGEVAVSGSSGAATLESGLVNTGNSGPAGVLSGNSASGNTGFVTAKSGNATSGNSGTVEIVSGNAPAGDSGIIYLQTGTAGGTRGHVEVNALFLDMNSTQVRGLANGSASDHAVNKSQLDLKLDLAGGTMSGNIAMGNNSITNLVMTADPHSAATRAYVDTVAEGLHVHAPARALANSDLGGTYNNGTAGVGAYLDFSASPIANIDGITSFAAGDRFILAKQNGSSLDAENGIYYIAVAGDIDGNGDITKLTRATDFDTPSEMAGGDFIFVQEGSTYADSGWVMTETVVTVGTTPVQFLQFSGAGAYSAGDGLDLTGTQFDVVVSELVGDGIEDDGSNNFRIKLDASSALAVSASGLKVDSSIEGNGLNFAAGVLSVDAGDGLEIGGSSELKVKIDGAAAGGLSFSLGGELELASTVAGDGLGLAAGVLSINEGDGLQISADTLEVKVSDFAGSGLEDDGLNNLQINVGPGLAINLSNEIEIASSAAGDGLSLAAGVLAVNAGDGIQIISDNVAAKVSDFAGNGLEDDGSNNLRIKKEFSVISDISVSASGLSIANRWGKEAYTIVAADTVLTSNYYDLDFEVEPNSLVAFVDRLAIHEGASFDYTLSVVSGVTRVTFLNELATPGQSKLSAGDQLFFTYEKKAK